MLTAGIKCDWIPKCRCAQSAPFWKLISESAWVTDSIIAWRVVTYSVPCCGPSVPAVAGGRISCKGPQVSGKNLKKIRRRFSYFNAPQWRIGLMFLPYCQNKSLYIFKAILAADLEINPSCLEPQRRKKSRLFSYEAVDESDQQTGEVFRRQFFPHNLQ